MTRAADNVRVAVITGTSSGIGQACARKFLSEGFRVYGLSRRPGEGIHIACDVSDAESVKAAFREIAAREDSIDVLICNAGMGISGAAAYAEHSDIMRIFGVNCMGVFSCVREALPLLRKGAHIVTVSSAAAYFAIPFQAYYSATKAAVTAYTQALRTELAVLGIRVCCVMPGDVHTGFTDARRKSEAGAEVYGQRIGKSIAAMEKDERTGMSPDHVADVIYRRAQQKNPPPLTTVGALYKVFIFLNRLFPTRLVEFIIAHMYS